MNFHPTYLYIKQHSITGKIYFGKTVKKDPVKYLGSGLHWASHIKTHGRKYVETLWYCLFHDQEEMSKFALMCSERWDIVKSDQWLNIKPETGIDGSIPGSKLSKEHKIKISSKMKGKIRSEIHCKNISISQKDRIFSTKHKERISLAKRGIKLGPPSAKHRSNLSIARKIKVKCPYCDLEGTKSNMSRYHFDNCKQKSLQLLEIVL